MADDPIDTIAEQLSLLNTVQLDEILPAPVFDARWSRPCDRTR